MSDIVMLLGALGGFEAVKWVVNSIVHRATNRRRENASVESMVDTNERTQVDWLEKRLAERDMKIDNIYRELRQEQSDKIQLIHEKHAIEMQLKEAEIRRCDVRGCKDRIPPSDY